MSLGMGLVVGCRCGRYRKVMAKGMGDRGRGCMGVDA